MDGLSCQLTVSLLVTSFNVARNREQVSGFMGKRLNSLIDEQLSGFMGKQLNGFSGEQLRGFIGKQLSGFMKKTIY